MFISEQSHLCGATRGNIKGAQLAFYFMFPVETSAPNMLGMENVIRHERLHAWQLILSWWQTRWGHSTVTHYNTPAGPAPDRVSVCGFHDLLRHKPLPLKLPSSAWMVALIIQHFNLLKHTFCVRFHLWCREVFFIIGLHVCDRWWMWVKTTIMLSGTASNEATTQETTEIYHV